MVENSDFAAQCYASAAYAVMRCPSVRPSVCMSRSCVLSKLLNTTSNVFHGRVATPFWFFHTKRHGNIPTGTPPPLTGGVKCRWGRQKSRFWANITAPSRAVNAATASCYQHGAAGSWQVTLIAGSKRRSLLMAGDDDEMFMTRNLNVMPKTKEQHLIVCSDKSVA